MESYPHIRRPAHCERSSHADRLSPDAGSSLALCVPSTSSATARCLQTDGAEDRPKQPSEYQHASRPNLFHSELEAGMHGLDISRTRKEELLHDDEVVPRGLAMPATPLPTPRHLSVGRSSTIGHRTPPLQVYDHRAVHVRQLATPPSEDKPEDARRRAFDQTHGSHSIRRHSLINSVAAEGLRLAESELSYGLRRLSCHDASVASPLAHGFERAVLQLDATENQFPVPPRQRSPADRSVSRFTFESSGTTVRGRANSLLSRDADEMMASVSPTHTGSRLRAMKLSTYRGWPEDHASGIDELSSISAAGFVLPDVLCGMQGAPPAAKAQYTATAREIYETARASIVQREWPSAMMGQVEKSAFQDVEARSTANLRASAPSYTHRREPNGTPWADDPLIEYRKGELMQLCRDQHGCRYLQRRLDEGDRTVVGIIFDEIHVHAAELMVDPFGNYLCQKLFERADDVQRHAFLHRIGPALPQICLNMHGTRATQKIIDELSSADHVDTLVDALASDPVNLIKDLNGNHVIQRCLTRLSSEQRQFVFDAASENCAEVATHRHGCCVMQRCFDYASDKQRKQLATEVINNATSLVQDAYGNYVVQYVLDLADQDVTDRIVRQLFGSITKLSMQKYSSNVVEKCLRVASGANRSLMIQEISGQAELDQLLRDSYANYVVQTALDFADARHHRLLVDAIRPMLPSIRLTPYGRRIQSKLSTPPHGRRVNDGAHAGRQRKSLTQQRNGGAAG